MDMTAGRLARIAKSSLSWDLDKALERLVLGKELGRAVDQRSGSGDRSLFLSVALMRWKRIVRASQNAYRTSNLLLWMTTYLTIEQLLHVHTTRMTLISLVSQRN